MRKFLRLIPIIAGTAVVALSGCAVPGDIGNVEKFFENSISLLKYEKDEESEENEYKQVDVDPCGIGYIIDDGMDFQSYSSVGLTFKGAQNSQAEITTITLELEFETSCDFNLTIYTDDELQYESGERSYTAKKTYSFVVSGIEYPSATTGLYFKNEPDSGKPDEEYDGYSACWKIKYLQIIYQGR